MLKSIFKSADNRVKIVAYTTIVQPSLEYDCHCLEYGTITWKKDIVLLEQVQNQTLWFIYGLQGMRGVQDTEKVIMGTYFQKNGTFPAFPWQPLFISGFGFELSELIFHVSLY